MTTANTCLAVFKMPAEKQIIEKGLVLALDSIRDPGNLGTILRCAIGLELVRFCVQKKQSIFIIQKWFKQQWVQYQELMLIILI